MSNKILDELIAAKVSVETISAVATLIAQAEIHSKIDAALAEKRARNAERMRSVRARANTCDNVQAPPHAYTTPQKKIDSKKNLSIPDDFVADLGYATRRGWSIEYATAEAARFRDHALAKGRKCRDWQAAWRNWVTSPYQSVPKPNGENPHDPLERRNGESLGALGRRLYAAARDREIAAGIDPANDPSPISESGD